MTPLHISDRCTIYNGDALAALRQLPQSSVDAVITDPPYCSGGTSPASRQADPANKYQSGGTKRDTRRCLATPKISGRGRCGVHTGWQTV